MGRVCMKPGSDALEFSLRQRLTLTEHWRTSVRVLYILGIVLDMLHGTLIASSSTTATYQTSAQIGIALKVPILSPHSGGTLAQAKPTDCPHQSVLERLRQHKVQPRETLTQIANRYSLVSATIMGMNPATRNGQVIPGQTLVIPPYNGILVSLTAGQTLQTVAQTYKVKPDVLFEVNGCHRNPKTVFVPGVNWSPVNVGPIVTIKHPNQPTTQVDPFLRQDHYPLPHPSTTIRAYGWQPNGPQKKIVFASGVDLAATPGTPVYAVADGTVAFVGKQNPWGNMIVINHTRGRQTRYGYLEPLTLKVGQRVQRGQKIATIGTTASQALRFELRYRSSLGWVAQDPQPYLQVISGSKKQPF
jgi:murein DD-endopeptidase MepM/ murein hydrolase activator NlpD